MYPLCLDAPICGKPPYVLMPLYVWMPLVCLEDVWMHAVHIQHKACFVRLRGYPYGPKHLDAPICLDALHMFGGSCVYLEDVWMPIVHIQHKESMLCQTEGVSICPHKFGCPHVWIPLYVQRTAYGWRPLICLDVPHTFGCPHTFGGIQTYGGHPNIQGVSQTCEGHLTILRGVQT